MRHFDQRVVQSEAVLCTASGGGGGPAGVPGAAPAKLGLVLRPPLAIFCADPWV